MLPENASALRVLGVFLKPFRWILLASALTGILLTAFELARLWAVSHLVDAVSRSAAFGLSQDTVLLFALLIAAYALLDPALWLVNYMLRMQSLSCQARASAQWQSHKAAARHDLAHFNTTHAGQVAGRIGQAAAAVQAGAELLAGRFPMGLVRFAGSAILVSYLAPVFLLPVLTWIALNGCLAVWLVPHFNMQAQKIAETASVVNGSLTEYFSNIRAIKTSFAYEVENDCVFDAITAQNRTHLDINRLTTLAGLCIRVLNTCLVAAILGLGMHGLDTRSLTPGAFVAGVTLAIGMAVDAGWFVAVWEGLTRTLGIIKDAQATIDARPRITSRNDHAGRLAHPPRIMFSNVTFAYDGKSEPALTDIDLVIDPGEKIGIVGPSGAGKSTLIDLLLRLYDVSSGQILIDGQDIRDMSLLRLRGSFAVVSQSDSLFHRSIRDNIAFGGTAETDEQIVQAARLADADGFIRRLPQEKGGNGYDMIVGARGAKLSGGQQQRILLARSFLQNRPILILDEATSALDSNSESLIQEAISSFTKDTSVIAIAHRLATVRDFDKIVVIEHGRILASGRHAELLAGCPLYRELWRKQTGNRQPR